jgi:hypothetical protein
MGKTCRKCGAAKEGRCQPCTIAYKAAYYARNKATFKIHAVVYKEAHRDEVRTRLKAYRAAHPQSHRPAHLMRRYGLTCAAYDTLLASQDFACAICRKQNIGKRAFPVDHDYSTGKIRGILCDGCNHGIGNFGDSIVLLDAAKEYLNVYK